MGKYEKRYSDFSAGERAIANELAEANRLKRLEIKLTVDWNVRNPDSIKEIMKDMA